MARLITQLRGQLSGQTLGLDPGPVPGANALLTGTSATTLNWGPNPNPVPEASTTSPRGIISGWMYVPQSITHAMWRMRNSGGGVQQEIDLGSTGIGAQVVGLIEPTVLSMGLVISSLTNYVPHAQWCHVMWSWQLPSIGHMAVNGRFVPIAERATNILGGGHPPFDGPQPNALQSFSSGQVAFYGLYINDLEFLDLTQQAAINRFINPSNYQPVQLGPTGANPTGNQPLIYFDSPAAQATNNRGFATDPVIANGVYLDSPHGPTSPARFAHDTNGGSNAGLSVLTTALAVGNTQLFTFSCWIRPDSTTGSIIFADDGSTTFMDIGWNGSDAITYTFRNSSGTIILQGTSSGSFFTDAIWHHLLFSVNMTAASGADAVRIVIDSEDDVTQAPTTFVGSESIGFGAAGCTLYVANDGSSANDLCYSQLWADFGAFIDFSDPLNVDLFVAFTGGQQTPITLGDNGENPLGSSPELFLDAPTFLGPNVQPHSENRGTGGDMTVIGTWVGCTTNPAEQYLI